MSITHDLFISHASADKQDYILPLANALTTFGVSFWLDSNEIGWGDNFVLKINQGLRSSRYALLCLSKNFLLRPWPENEMSSVLSLQSSDGQKRALPLLLNSKEEILKTYPLLSALTYREYESGVDSIVRDLVKLTKKTDAPDGLLEVVIESAHTEQYCSLRVSPKVSVKWLIDKAEACLNVKREANSGSFTPFMIRWVLVDVRAEAEWRRTPREKQQTLYAIVRTEEGIRYCTSEYDRVESLGLSPKTVFHLYPIEDIRFDSDPPIIVSG